MIQSSNNFEDRLNILWSLETLLYSVPGCSCGGPLHIVLDDGNVRDSDIAFCRAEVSKEQWKHVEELCVCILDMLTTLSPAQRLYWWEHMSIKDIMRVVNKDIISTGNGYEVKE